MFSSAQLRWLREHSPAIMVVYDAAKLWFEEHEPDRPLFSSQKRASAMQQRRYLLRRRIKPVKTA
jgi:hypothetical protein